MTLAPETTDAPQISDSQKLNPSAFDLTLDAIVQRYAGTYQPAVAGITCEIKIVMERVVGLSKRLRQ